MLIWLKSILIVSTITIFVSAKAFPQSERSITTRNAQPTAGVKQSDKPSKHEDNVAERERFFYDRLTSGDIKDVDQIHRLGLSSFSSMDNRSAMMEQNVPTWNSIGFGIGGLESGRVRAIAFDPVDSNIAYIASTVGGVWKTNNYNATPVVWQPLSDNLPTLVCGSLAIPAQQPKTIYLGTGEVLPGWVSSKGFGVFKSIDGGLNWQNVLSSTIMGPVCSAIAIDPANPASIYVAAPGSFIDIAWAEKLGRPDTLQEYGLFHSNNGGTSWTKFQIAPGFYPVSIVVSPVNSNRLIAGGINAEVYSSTDGGNSWFKCTPKFLDSVGAPVIAIAPSSPNIVFMNTTNFGGVTQYETLFESRDSGVTWQALNRNVVPCQELYDVSLAIDPQDYSHVLVGGVDTFESFDEGQSFDQVSFWQYQGQPADTTSYTHADSHCLVFHNGSVFSGNDGGVSRYQAGLWFNSANAGIPTLEFVGADADKNFTYILGGLQDNGTTITTVQNGQWQIDRGGDGGYTWVSPINGNIAYTTYTGPDIYRSTDGGLTWSDDNTFRSLVTNQTLLSVEGALFYAPYDASPSGNVVAFAGIKHMFVSKTGGADGFNHESKQLVDTAQSVRISPRDSLHMWAGATGKIYRSTDEGADWYARTTGVNGNVVGIEVGPTDSTLYAVVGGLTSDSNAHFINSTDSGKTWTKRATNFPMTPANSMARSTTGQLFVGTDYGVITSTDDGLTWAPVGIGLPRVQVLSLKVKGANDQYLIAGTHGRGVYWIQIPTAGVAESKPVSFAMTDCYPNPVTASNTSAQINFTLDKPEHITLRLYDALGREVSTLAKDLYSAGSHTASIPTSNLPTGEYFVALQSEGQTAIRKMTVLR